MLRVTDLDKSIEYYEKCLGMQCLRRKDNEGALSILFLITCGHACSPRDSHVEWQCSLL